MGDSLMTILAIFLAVMLMFFFPMLSVSERTDSISQLAVEAAVTDFVDNSRSMGKVTVANYEKLVNALNATGNSYQIEMQRKALDENVGKKTAWLSKDVWGENGYITYYNSQILETLLRDEDYLMNEGDTFYCKAENDNVTLSQTFRSVFYSTSSNNAYQVSAQHSGIVTATGK